MQHIKLDWNYVFYIRLTNIGPSLLLPYSPIIIVSMITWHGKSVDVMREIAIEKYHHITSEHHFEK